MLRKLAAQFIGTAWLVPWRLRFGGSGGGLPPLGIGFVSVAFATASGKASPARSTAPTLFGGGEPRPVEVSGEAPAQ